jgi:parallel beta-helix repeat protein
MIIKTPIVKVSVLILLTIILSSCHKERLIDDTNSPNANTSATNNFYVDGTNGIDSNDGKTATTAWKTIQKSFNSATPGSTVWIKGGTYHEELTVNVSGTASAPIIFRNYNSIAVYIDGSTISGSTILTITDKSNLIFKNLVVNNITKNNAQGILVVATKNGGVRNLAFKHITIQRINWLSNANAIPNSANNSQALIVYGQGATPQNAVSNLTIDSCEVSNNILGFSEGVSLDGNIDGFKISNNRVNDNTNIGIAAIGHYGTSSTPSLDQARNGIITGNTCYNDNSRYAASGGIYVDGARDIVIERNLCYKNGYGVEVGNEENGTVTNITVADNILYLNAYSGLAVGGYNTATTGQVLGCTFRNNTFYRNNSLLDGSGEIIITKASDCIFENNIFYTNSQNLLYSITPIAPQANNKINYNCWYTAAKNANDIQVNWPNKTYTTFSSYQTATHQDVNSFFADPLFINAMQTAPNFHLSETSLCINAGNTVLITNTAELDFAGAARLNKGKVDIGAYQSH